MDKTQEKQTENQNTVKKDEAELDKVNTLQSEKNENTESQKTQEKIIGENKTGPSNNSLFSGNFTFNKDKINSNLFNNSKPAKQVQKAKKINPDEQVVSDDEEPKQKNKKIDQSKPVDQEQEKPSIFGNANVKNIFSSSKNFFGVKPQQGSLFGNNKPQSGLFSNQGNNDDKKGGLFQNNSKPSIFNNNTTNLFNNQQNNSEKKFFENHKEEEDADPEKDQVTKFGQYAIDEAKKLKKVEQVYPFDIIISTKIDKIKIDNEEPIENGFLSLEKSKEKDFYLLIMKSTNKTILHESLFLPKISPSKISEKNQVILMIKSFKLKKDNSKNEKEESKNIESKEKKIVDNEKKTESEAKHHFLKIKFMQPSEAKEFYDKITSLELSN